MSRSSIVDKLRLELGREITTEPQVVYVLAEIRKVLEQANDETDYFALEFYCSFALHTKMSKAGAKRILERFDKAHPFLVKREEIPRDLGREIDETIHFRRFESQLKQFLKANELPTRLFTEDNEWLKFIQLYGGVIDEGELLVEGNGVQLDHIDRVVVRLLIASEPLGNGVPFQLRWICHGKDGRQGEHFVIFVPV
jgi:hypothetical protein